MDFSKPQVFNCPVCGQYQGSRASERFIARLENPEDLGEIYRLNGLELPDNLKNAKFNDHFTGTDFSLAKTYYDQVPVQVMYNFIKQFEPDYLAFGYPLPFDWLGIPPVDLNEYETTTLFKMPNNRPEKVFHSV